MITTPHKYPWTAGMFFDKTHFTCGGTIISDITILTAAHCMVHEDSNPHMDWVLGMHNQTARDGEAFKMKSIKIHPHYKTAKHEFSYDVSIVVLDKLITFKHNIRPICLPQVNEDFSGKRAIAAGW
jgi:serine protease 56